MAGMELFSSLAYTMRNGLHIHSRPSTCAMTMTCSPTYFTIFKDSKVTTVSKSLVGYELMAKGASRDQKRVH